MVDSPKKTDKSPKKLDVNELAKSIMDKATKEHGKNKDDKPQKKKGNKDKGESR